jgi:hypothetical protein
MLQLLTSPHPKVLLHGLHLLRLRTSSQVLPRRPRLPLTPPPPQVLLGRLRLLRLLTCSPPLLTSLPPLLKMFHLWRQLPSPPPQMLFF